MIINDYDPETFELEVKALGWHSIYRLAIAAGIPPAMLYTRTRRAFRPYPRTWAKILRVLNDPAQYICCPRVVIVQRGRSAMPERRICRRCRGTGLTAKAGPRYQGLRYYCQSA